MVPVLLALLVAGFVGYWGYDQFTERQQLETYMGNTYQQSFYELVEQIEQMQVLMGKSLVSTSPRQNIMILTDVWSHANSAQAELNKLPLAAQTVTDTAKFLAQTGDFAHVMARQNAEGKVLTSEERETLSQLRQHAIQVAESLHQVENEVLAGKVNWVQLVRNARRGLKREEETEEGRTGVDTGEEYVQLDDIREEMTKIPTLIYDGPFSDHITEREPREMSGQVISQENARDRAREIIDAKDGGDISVSEGTSVNARIPSFNFQIKTNNGIYSVDIAKKGGHLVNILNNRDVDSAKISREQAVDKARDYLARIKYPNMEPTYSEVQQNIAFISFAYKNNNIIYYPDIINVQVAMDNGQVLAVEALSYLMSHHEREVEEPEVTEEVARELASGSLEKIDSVRLAVIPKSSLREVLTYEVRGNSGNETYLIYVNAETGMEEQILEVILGEQGTFAL
ncbi:MAG: germination protein YpeB [Halanaerobiales bacterium]